MNYKEYLVNVIDRVKSFLSSSRGRDVVLYLVFVFVSFIFWSILVMNNQMQEHYKVKFAISNIPGNVTIINDVPKEIRVSVKNTGYALFKYIFGKTPEVDVPFDKYSDKKGNVVIKKQDIEGMLVDVFGNDATIVSVFPTDISVKYTTLPAKKLPLLVSGNFSSNFQYVINGKIKSSIDSVYVYSDEQTLFGLTMMKTERVNMKELKDTVVYTVAVEKMKNVKTIPDSVTIVVPVEPLIAASSEVVVKAAHVPNGYRLLAFPTKIKASYFVPMSDFEKVKSCMFDVYVDFEDINKGYSKLPIKFANVPTNFQNVVLQNDSVEFIVEHL